MRFNGCSRIWRCSICGLSDLAATEVIRKVRELHLVTRCAVFSTRKDRKTVLEVLRNGACGYVLKSSTPEQMAEALMQFARGGIYVSPQIEVMSLFGERSGRMQLDDPLDTLSSREFQVFSLLVEGVRAKEIAARLSLSPKTVDTYRSSLMRKLDIHDVAGFVKFAIRRDLADVQSLSVQCLCAVLQMCYATGCFARKVVVRLDPA